MLLFSMSAFYATLVAEEVGASYIFNIIRDPVYSDIGSNFDDEYVEFDADVKIPGRHFPKLPYMKQLREESRFFPHDLFAKILFVSHTTNGDILSRRRKEESNEGYDDFEYSPQRDATISPKGPYFDRSLPRNLTVQTGKTAVLSCRVLNREEKTVSWIRLHDLHILTVDKYKYSTDQRFSVVYNEVNKEWVLRIIAAKHSDQGKYECQVSTKPVLSYIVDLTIVDDLLISTTSTTTPFPRLNDERLLQVNPVETKVPRAHVVNSPDVYVHRGSLINLTCVVNHGTDQPVFIYWHHYNKLVDIEDKRRDVELTTREKGKTVSHLLVRRATFDDSGVYTCKPSNGEDASVTLHILTGELQQAAMQTNTGVLSSASWTAMAILLVLLHVTEKFAKCFNCPG